MVIAVYELLAESCRRDLRSCIANYVALPGSASFQLCSAPCEYDNAVKGVEHIKEKYRYMFNDTFFYNLVGEVIQDLKKVTVLRLQQMSIIQAPKKPPVHNESIMAFRTTSIKREVDSCRRNLRNCIADSIDTPGCKRYQLLTALCDYARRPKESQCAGWQSLAVPIDSAIKRVELVKENYKILSDPLFYKLVEEVAQDSLENILVSELREMCENVAPRLLQMSRKELTSSRSVLSLFVSIIRKTPPVHNAITFEHNGSIKTFPGTSVVSGNVTESCWRDLRNDLAALCDYDDNVKCVKHCIKLVEEAGQDSLENFIVQLQQVVEETVKEFLETLTELQLQQMGIKKLMFSISKPTFLLLRLSIARDRKEPPVHNGSDRKGKGKLEQIDAGSDHHHAREGHHMLSEVAETGRPTGPTEKELLANRANDEPLVHLLANCTNEEQDLRANEETEHGLRRFLGLPGQVNLSKVLCSLFVAGMCALVMQKRCSVRQNSIPLPKSRDSNRFHVSIGSGNVLNFWGNTNDKSLNNGANSIS